MYDTDPSVLRAFANTGVEFVVGLTDRCVEGVTTPDGAMAWIKGNIQPYVPATKISMITVGNEVRLSKNYLLYLYIFAKCIDFFLFAFMVYW